MLLPICASAQVEEIVTVSDTMLTPEVHYIADTMANRVDSGYTHAVYLHQKPDAIRAVWLGALVPGLGQIYNKSYWKLPIVYGAFMGCGYAIGWTNTKYTDYKEAYRDIYSDAKKGIVDGKDPTKSYVKILPKGYTIDRMGSVSTYTETLNKYQNMYRRYRDISIVATILVYGLTLIDAYVDAQLFDFDISPDLSLEVTPQIYNDLQNNKSAEVHVAFNF